MGGIVFARLVVIVGMFVFSCAGCAVITVDVTNPVPQLSTVAVAPFFNQSTERTVDGRRFASAYFSELQKIPGYQVVPTGVTETAIRRHQLDLTSSADVIRLAEILQVDVVVVGSVTEYDPYYPPRIGLHVDWHSPHDYAFVPPNPPMKMKCSKWWPFSRYTCGISDCTIKNCGGSCQSSVSFRAQNDAEWQTMPMVFESQNAIGLVNTRPIKEPLQQSDDFQSLANWRSSSNTISNTMRRISKSDSFLVPREASPHMRNSFNGLSVQATNAQQQVNDALPPLPSLEPEQDSSPDQPPSGTIIPQPDSNQLPSPPSSRSNPEATIRQHQDFPDWTGGPKYEPIMSYTRMFDGRDAEVTAALRDYVELSGDRRSGHWPAYLERSDDFIRFAAHRMIVEMLLLHGGEAKRKLVLKLRKEK